MATTPEHGDQASVAAVWRTEAPHVLGALARRWRDFDACEDAAQEALDAAMDQWPRDGLPDRPRAWLIRVASRRLIDAHRADRARRRREERVAGGTWAPPADESPATALGLDDTLGLLLLCCSPVLSSASQVALTLRAVGGLTTEQIAAAFFVPTATMAQRISRAKATLHAEQVEFGEPDLDTLVARLGLVRHVLYLVFNEGYATSGGDQLVDVELSAEAIRLGRHLHDAVPADPESAGLLALMLLTDARRSTRTDERGDLVPLEDQDRSRWDGAEIAEGVGLLEAALPVGDVGPFQLQGAIAAVHAESPTWVATDWAQIGVLYGMLERVAPSPTVTLNRAVAVAMVAGPDAGLALVEPLLADDRQRRQHRVHAVRAHLLEMAGRADEAIAGYERAATLTASTPEQRYLHRRVAALRQC